MERQIPKNIRQIGNVCDNFKIYIEDYVDTFLSQLEENCGAFLVGENVTKDENEYLYVYGAVHMQELTLQGKDFIIEETVWKKACEETKAFFGNAEILGWCLAGGEEPITMNHNIQKLHQTYFARDKTIFAVRNKRGKEDSIYIQKYHELLEAKGYYVYYEKNPEMQDYMVSYRKAEGITPSEVIEDKAAKSFRSMIQDKTEAKKEKIRFQPSRVVGVCTMAFILMGVITWYDQQERLGYVPEIETEAPEVSEEQEEQLTAEEEVSASLEEDLNKEAQKTEEVLEEAEQEEEEMEETAGVQLEEIYVVKKGDTLASISKEVYGSITYVNDICELNGLSDGNLIFIGQKLLLP